MRIISTSACALAVVCMAGSVSADGRRPLALVSAQVSVRGFSASGRLVCGLTEPTTCGNGVLDSGEEFDPAPAGFDPALINTNTCKFNFSQVTQLYCNGRCSVAGPSGCDQADADLLCKLKTGNPNSVAASFGVEMALGETGFTCPGSGTPVLNLSGRGIDVAVSYGALPVGGNSVTNVSCTNP